MINKYFQIMRIDHWIKNLFMLPGCAIALAFTRDHFALISSAEVATCLLAMVSLCLASSANYTINEWLDRDFDKIHPFKGHRVASKYNFNPKIIYAQYVLLITLSLIFAYLVNNKVLFLIITLVTLGFFYNVKPFRTKDRHYLDVISESVNNPIRLSIGWYSLEISQVIPASAFIAFWGAGVYLMALKRYAEMEMIQDKVLLGTYRKSFLKWSPEKLLTMSLAGGFTSMAFAGVLLTRYRLEYVLLLPVLILLHTEYFKMTLALNQASIAPEKLMSNRNLRVIVAVLAVLFVVLTFCNFPFLYSLIGPIGGK